MINFLRMIIILILSDSIPMITILFIFMLVMGSEGKKFSYYESLFILIAILIICVIMINAHLSLAKTLNDIDFISLGDSYEYLRIVIFISDVVLMVLLELSIFEVLTSKGRSK